MSMKNYSKRKDTINRLKNVAHIYIYIYIYIYNFVLI